MLCESLALLLIEEGILSKRRVVEAIDGIIEVKQEIAGVTEDVAVSMKSIVLLVGIARSLEAAPVPGLAS